MKYKHLVLDMLLLIGLQMLGLPILRATPAFELTPTQEHHVARLNSDQPFVAGFHVDTADLSVRKTVDAVAATVKLSRNSAFFPQGSWLGVGIFVQAQDHVFRNVDYGFYMILVMDSLSRIFIDLGLHQTRERTAPIHMPTAETIYTYTWQVSGVDPSTEPVTIEAFWNSNGFLDYSVSVSGYNKTLISIDVAGFPNCQNIIRRFYVGNVIIDPFPFSRYVSYFLFGVISNEPITNTHWDAHLRKPMMLRGSNWTFVNEAWSILGDISYLDYDWKWGGVPYYGVEAEPIQSLFDNSHELVFSYTGHNMVPGRVLWHDFAADSDFEATSNTSLSRRTGANWSMFWFSMLTVTGSWLVFAGIRRKIHGSN